MQNQRPLPQCCQLLEAKLNKMLLLANQKNTFLQSEVQSLKDRLQKNKYINHSLAQFYKSNQEDLQRSQTLQGLQHQLNLMKVGKNSAQQAKSRYEEQIRCLRLELQQQELKYQRKILEVRKQLQSKFSKDSEEDRQSLIRRNQHLQAKLLKAENTIRQFKRYIDNLKDIQSNRASLPALNYSFVLDQSQRSRNLLMSKVDLTKSIALRPSAPQNCFQLKQECNVLEMIKMGKLNNQPRGSISGSGQKVRNSISVIKKQKSKSKRKERQRTKENLGSQQIISQLTSRITKVVSNLQRSTNCASKPRLFQRF